MLKKYLKNFYVSHLHANNYQSYNQDGFPINIEITFINKMLYKDFPTKNKIPLPIHNLDFPNNRKYKDIILNDYPFNFSNKIIMSNSRSSTTLFLVWCS